MALALATKFMAAMKEGCFSARRQQGACHDWWLLQDLEFCNV